MGEDGEWRYACQAPTAKEVHAVVKVWPSVFEGSSCHATDASTSHCLGSLNRLDVLLETGEIPPASPRCSPPAYLLEVLRVSQATYFRQLYAYDRIRLDSIITGGVAATYAFGGSNATTSRGSNLIVKSDIFGYPIYVVPLRHFQASGNTLSHDVHGEFVAERALLLSALEVAPALNSPADLASPANLAAPASTASTSSATLNSSSSASQHPSLRTASPASVKIIPIAPEPCLERAAELHDLLDSASGRAERSTSSEDALVEAGVDSNASGLAALQHIAADLRERDLCLPSYATGGARPTRSSTSPVKSAASTSKKASRPSSDAAASSRSAAPTSRSHGLPKPRVPTFEYPAGDWPPFQLSSPFRTIHKCLRVRFPVDEAAGPSGVLAQKPKQERLDVLQQALARNRSEQHNFSHVLPDPSPSGAASLDFLSDIIPVALLESPIDNPYAVQPVKSTPLNVLIGKGKVDFLSNYFYLVETFATPEDAQTWLDWVDDRAVRVGQGQIFERWLAGAKRFVALGGWSGELASLLRYAGESNGHDHLPSSGKIVMRVFDHFVSTSATGNRRFHEFMLQTLSLFQQEHPEATLDCTVTFVAAAASLAGERG
ncbi:hypothetical protein JCM10296v2_003926 [Rhodotorula toruloides]